MLNPICLGFEVRKLFPDANSDVCTVRNSFAIALVLNSGPALRFSLSQVPFPGEMTNSALKKVRPTKPVPKPRKGIFVTFTGHFKLVLKVRQCEKTRNHQWECGKETTAVFHGNVEVKVQNLRCAIWPVLV